MCEEVWGRGGGGGGGGHREKKRLWRRQAVYYSNGWPWTYSLVGCPSLSAVLACLWHCMHLWLAVRDDSKFQALHHLNVCRKREEESTKYIQVQALYIKFVTARTPWMLLYTVYCTLMTSLITFLSNSLGNNHPNKSMWWCTMLQDKISSPCVALHTYLSFLWL